DVLEACGGFDGGLGAYDYEVYELSLRLWRLGERVAVAREASVSCPRPVRDLDGGELDWGRFAHELFRLATIHLSEGRIVPLIDGMRQRPGAGAALAGVLVSDAPKRRAELVAAQAPLADGLLDGNSAPAAAVADVSAETWRPPAPAGASAVADVSAETWRPSRVPVSLVLTGLVTAEVEARVADLAAGLGPGAEVVTATSRAAGGRVARGEVLLFASLEALPEVEVARQLLATVRAEPDRGTDRSGGPARAAGPAVRVAGQADRLLGGVTVQRRLLDARWLPAPDRTGPVPFLSGVCTTVMRARYEELGGYDEALEGTGLEDVELSLRWWRSGGSCLIVPGAVVEVCGSWLWAGRRQWDDELFGLLRLAALHLEAADHAGVIERVSMWRGFPSAVARVASGDVGVRRAAIDRGSLEGAGPVLRRLCGEALFERSEPAESASAEGDTPPAAGAPLSGAGAAVHAAQS
ncbi:MAG TPA: hypothetical protein VMD59_10855, partial [Acidimicrobiales bacterium]|nr:hypothetical protein [Acidimicrobiales bacterium]